MSDPNADLIGYIFHDDAGRPCEVTSTSPWSSNYVEVDCAGTLTTRAASLVRTSRQGGTK